LVERVVIGRALNTVSGWRREVTRIYIEMRKGKLLHEFATRQVYVANIAAQLTKVEEELRNQARIIEELRRVQSQQHPSVPALDYGASVESAQRERDEAA
jgi:hypothetical protein